MARPDPTSSRGEGGVNSLPSLESAPGLWGRIWGTTDPSSPMKPDVPGPGVGSPHTHRAGLEGGQEDTSGTEGPTEGMQGDARIPALLRAAHRTRGAAPLGGPV